MDWLCCLHWLRVGLMWSAVAGLCCLLGARLAEAEMAGWRGWLTGWTRGQTGLSWRRSQSTTTTMKDRTWMGAMRMIGKSTMDRMTMMTSVKKRTSMIANRSAIVALDGVLPRSPVSVAMMPWDEADAPPAPKVVSRRLYNGK